MTQQQERTAQQIADMVSAARASKKLSRRAAARLAGVSASTWDNVERGQYFNNRTGEMTPTVSTPETLVKITGAVGLNMESVLEIAGFPPEAATAQLPSAATSVTVDVGDLDELEQAELRGFLAGLKTARNRHNR